MKRAIVAAAVLLGASVLLAQKAEVIQLEKSDADFAREKWNALQDAQKDWDREVERIRTKYVGSSVSPIVKAGWEYGIEFSGNFKFIVPKPYQQPTQLPCWGGTLGGGCWTTTPGILLNGSTQ